MRRLFAWIGGVAGGLAAYRFLRRRPAATAPGPEVGAESDERAEELRAKLAETRLDETVVMEPAAEDAPASAEPAAEEPPAEAESADERRRRVHEEGRAAIDEMQQE